MSVLTVSNFVRINENIVKIKLLTYTHILESFMVVDCGGGTVDLTTRKLLEGDKLGETIKRKGGYCGGSFVDDEFIKFLSRKVGQSAIDLLRKNRYSQLY